MSSPQKTTIFGWPVGMARSLPSMVPRASIRIRGSNDAAESKVAHGRLDRLRRAGGRPIAMAVVRSAQVRAALDNHPREVLPGTAHVVTGVRRRHTRVEPRPARAAAGVHDRLRMPRRIEIARPFPDVAGDVMQAVTVWREGPDGGRALVLVEQQVLPRELALPRVRKLATLRGELVAPRVGGA